MDIIGTLINEWNNDVLFKVLVIVFVIMAVVMLGYAFYPRKRKVLKIGDSDNTESIAKKIKEVLNDGKAR
jgi:Tfp pilus assembly protein PilO